MATAIRTTLALPADLLAEADRVVEEGGAKSRNELVASALRRELAVRQREAIDAAIAEMAEDDPYEDDVRQIMAEFSTADSEALKLSDRSS